MSGSEQPEFTIVGAGLAGALLACYLGRVLTGNYKMGMTRHAFEAATVGGAKILRRPDLGRIAPGCKADFSLIDMNHPHMQPAIEPVATSLAIRNTTSSVSKRFA